MKRLSVVFAVVLVCGGVGRANFSGIDMLSESYHVWGGIDFSGFHESYNTSDSVPVEGSLSVAPDKDIWTESRTWSGPGMMGPGSYDAYGVWAWAANFSDEPSVVVDAGAEVILTFRPLHPVVQLAWWTEPTFGGTGAYSSLKVTDTSDLSTLYFQDNVMPTGISQDDVWLSVDPTHVYSLHLYSGMSAANDSPTWAELVTLQSIPAPGAFLLSAIGSVLVVRLRRRTR